MNRADLNCDMGESFGRYQLGNDEALLSHVTSANIACGFHAGDPSTMRRTMRSAITKGVAIGAHPGYPDMQGFGRRFMEVTPQDAYDLVVYQVGALQGFASALGARLQHVKPHGALYNAVAADASLAAAIAAAVRDVDDALILFGLARSELVTAGENAGLRTASEGFADRRYLSDGTLASRRRPDALITEREEAVDQAITIVKEGKVRSIDGADVEVRADTICIHGDGPEAVEFARAIREHLERNGIEVRPIGKPPPAGI